MSVLAVVGSAMGSAVAWFVIGNLGGLGIRHGKEKAAARRDEESSAA